MYTVIGLIDVDTYNSCQAKKNKEIRNDISNPKAKWSPD